MRLILICICIIFLAAIGGCAEPVDPTMLRMGLATAPIDLDPRRATDAASNRINRLLYRRLVEFDAANRPVPGLAIWTQPTPNVYSFKLLDDIAGRTFANGHLLTADDIKATFASILDPATGSPYRTQLASITNMLVLDTNTIEISIQQPDPLFPTRLVMEILPAELINSTHPFHHLPVGSGPFSLLAWPQPGRLKLTRRSDGQVLEFIEVKDPGVRVMKLLRGEINLLQSDLSPELFKLLRNNNQLQVMTQPGSNFTYLGLHLQDPALSKLPVRQAIAHAIDIKLIIRYLLDNNARLAQSLLPPEHWAGTDSLPAITYDPVLARKLLRKAGYGPKKQLELTYKTSTDPFRLRLATVIQAQLEAVGINIKVQSLDWGTLYGDIKAGRFQIYSLTWVGIKTPEHFRAITHSASVPPKGANRGHYNNPVVDAMLDQVQHMPDLAAQAKIYHKLQRLLLDDLPYIPLWYEDQIAVAKQQVLGYTPAEDGNFDALSKTYHNNHRGNL